MKWLTRQEEIYLLAIWKQKENAYGVQISKQIAAMTGRKPSYGALYFTLEQLHKKKYVTRTKGEPTPVRGGCKKIYYELTPAGKKALKAAHELQQVIWQDISTLSFE